VGYDEIGSDGVRRFKAVEVYPNLSMDPNHRNYAIAVVGGASSLVELSLDGTEAAKLHKNGKLVGTKCPAGTTPPPTYFRDIPAATWQKGLAINLNGLGTQVVVVPNPTFAPVASDGTADPAADAVKVALAITLAVQAISTEQPFKNFSCTYVTDHFEMTTPISASGSVSVSPGEIAAALGLDKATLTHGSVDLVPANAPAAAENKPSSELTQGAASQPTTQDDWRNGFAPLKKVADITIVVLPANPLNSPGETAVGQALAHCMETASRVLLIDPPKGKVLATAGDVDMLGLPTSSYAICYYPWVKVRNPAYHPEKNPLVAKTIEVAPSAFMAGMFSRIDGRRGVWKAPAGVEAALVGAAGLADDVGDGQQDQLNPLGINCIRKLPSFGPVVWGSRTLATKADPEWRYVPVRRTAIMLEQSIFNGIQWAVFEPNDHRLWAALRVNIGSFMDGLFRAGAFQGEKSSDAYFVRCGLGDTMTQGDIDRGQVIVLVGFAPLKPAEFVIVRIQQKVQQ
jgi:uncharacterized protein